MMLTQRGMLNRKLLQTEHLPPQRGNWWAHTVTQLADQPAGMRADPPRISGGLRTVDRGAFSPVNGFCPLPWRKCGRYHSCCRGLRRPRCTRLPSPRAVMGRPCSPTHGDFPPRPPSGCGWSPCQTRMRTECSVGRAHLGVKVWNTGLGFGLK